MPDLTPPIPSDRPQDHLPRVQPASTTPRAHLIHRPPWQRALPNILTTLRVAIAVLFFAVLTRWRWEDSLAQSGKLDGWLLLGASLFIIAGLTDVLDGYLARSWNVESGFGRIMDPFADKFLILGGFVFLASADFWWEFNDPAWGGVIKLSGHGMQISGIYPWMVVTVMARELLVTSLRGYVESRGFHFPADRWGKLKMFLQSVAIPVSLIATAITPVVPIDPTTSWLTWPWGRQVIDVVVRLMVAVTVLSAIPYVWRAVGLLRQRVGADSAATTAMPDGTGKT